MDGIALTIFFVVAVMLPNIVLTFSQDYPLWHRLTMLLLPAGFYTVWCSLLPRSGVMILLGIPFMFFAAFQVVLFYLLQETVISVDMFTNLGTTNSSESLELLHNIYPVILSACSLYIVLILLAVYSVRRRRVIRPAARRNMLFVGGFLLAAGIGSSFGAMAETRGFTALDDIFPINAFRNRYLSQREWMKVKRYEKSCADFCFDATKNDHAPQREIYLFVIGESSRACNWPAYGYDRPTTPNLTNRGDQIVWFQNILTQSNSTHKSVPLMLSPIGADTHDYIYRYKGLLALFREAGFHTMFVSNQARNRAMIDHLGKQADTAIFLQDHHRRNNYDSNLLPFVRKAILRDTADLFIVLHTYGSHFNYNGRYPASFAKFFPDRITSLDATCRERMINAYDNSILYTDYLLDQLIRMLERSQTCTALFFSPDHGEDIFDDDRNRFLHSSPSASYYQLHIPCMVWFSAGYSAAYTERVASARSHTASPATTHAYFHTLADMASIESPYVSSHLSLVNPVFDSSTVRHYLNDQYQAVDYLSVGLQEEDFAIFRKRKIHLSH